MRPIDRVLETILYVDDLDAAERFYGGVLGLELDSRKPGLFVFFKCGTACCCCSSRRRRAPVVRVPPHGAKGPVMPASRSPSATSMPGRRAWRRLAS